MQRSTTENDTSQQGPSSFWSVQWPWGCTKPKVRLCSHRGRGKPTMAHGHSCFPPPRLSQGLLGDSLPVLTLGSAGRMLLTGAAQQCHVLGNRNCPLRSLSIPSGLCQQNVSQQTCPRLVSLRPDTQTPSLLCPQSNRKGVEIPPTQRRDGTALLGNRNGAGKDGQRCWAGDMERLIQAEHLGDF